MWKQDWHRKNGMARWLSPPVYSSGTEMPIDVREGVSVVLPKEGTWTDLEPAYETVMLDEKDAFLWIETTRTEVSLTRLSPSLMDPEFRGTVEARGWVYVSQEMENAMVVGLVLGTAPEQLFKQAEREVIWAACQRAEMEMERMEVRVELGDRGNMRRPLRTMRCVLPPFLVDAVFGTRDRLKRICRLMTRLRLYQSARQDFFRLSVEAGPFEGNWAEELAKHVFAALTADFDLCRELPTFSEGSDIVFFSRVEAFIISQDQGKEPIDSSTSARQGHNTKTFDSPFKVDPKVDGKRDDQVWYFVARGRYLDGSTAAAAKEHFSKSEKFRCEAATPAVWNAIWSKDMTKCPKEFASAIETLQSLLPGHPSLQWPPLRFPKDAVPPPVPATAPSEPVASPNSGTPAIRVTTARPATTVATRPTAPTSAPLVVTRGARDVEVGRSMPANEPPTVRNSAGTAAFDEDSTRAFIESRRWGGSVGSSTVLAPVFRGARQSDAARVGAAVAPGASPRGSSEHPWLPPPPSRAAQRPVVHQAHATALPDPSHTPADARQSASVPCFREQADHGVPAEEVPAPVSDSSPTPIPTTTGGGRSAPQPPPVLTGSLDPLHRIRDLAVAQSAAPASPGVLLDVGVLGGRATTGRCRGTYRQQAVTSYYSDPLERAWHLQIMRFIVESGMPFNCSKLESFKRMFTMIIPPGFRGRPCLDFPPTTCCARPFWTSWMTLCNYLVGIEIGVVYVATDVMRGKKNASALPNAWLKRVKSMDIQLSDITAFVTDSAGVNVAAMEVFQKDESVKHIFWIPCVAHIMDLILEDIGGIDWVASRIAQARLIIRFFKRHETVWSTSKSRKDAAEVTACIGSPPWWEDLRSLCKMLEPIMDMLKLVDSDTRQISKILQRYEEMIASCLSACRDIDRDQQDAIVEVFHRRRTMFKTPAHTAAMLLDPEFRDPTLCDNAEVQQALVEALVQFGYPEDSPQHREVQRAVAKLHTRDPPFDELTMRRAVDIYDHPASFWSPRRRSSLTRPSLQAGSFVYGRPHHRAREPGLVGASFIRSLATSCRFPGLRSLCGATGTSGYSIDLHCATMVLERGPASSRNGCIIGRPWTMRQPWTSSSSDAPGGDGSHQLSDGVSSVRPPDEGEQREAHRGSMETLEERHPRVIRSEEGVAHDTTQPRSTNAARFIGEGIERIGSSTTHDVGGGGGGGVGGADATRSFEEGIERIGSSTAHDVGDAHIDEPRPHLMGMRDILRPPPSRSPAADPVAHRQASQSALPTRSFYGGAAMDRRACDIGHASSCGPADVPAGARLIGNVDGTCHGSMRAYEEQHGRPIRAKTTEVLDTRTASARLSRTRKKGTGASIPYHRRRLHPFFCNRDETGQMPAAADGRGGVDGGDRVDDSGRGEKRRGGTMIIHDDSSTAAEGGETTGADDPDDSDYVPRIRTADRDDGGGRRVRMRTGPGPEGHCTPSVHLPPIDPRARARSLLGKGIAMEEKIEDQQSKGSQGTNEDGERNKGSARDRESAKPEGTREDGKDLSIGESSGKVGGSKRGPQENREGGNDTRTSPRNLAGTTPKKTKVADTSRKLAEIEKRTAEFKAKLIEQMMVGDEGDPQGAGSREGRRTSQDETRYEGKDNSHKGTPSKKGKDKGDPPTEGIENAMTPPAIDSGTSKLPATPKVTGACAGLWSLRERVLGWFDPEGTPKTREKQRESKEGEETSAVGEAGGSEDGLQRVVATLTRTLNKNQGYLADAKKKLTFDGANITEFLIDYENLAALLKWTEEEKMEHLGQHVSLSLGRYILDARENLSGYVKAVALKKKTGKGVADWIEDFYLRHPFVRRFIADNGTEFVNQVVLGRLKALCVPIKIIEPYHPEANAPVEKGHRTLKNTIAKLAVDDLGNWPRYLKQAVFSENMTPKRTTGCISAELWYGREIDFPVEALVPTWNRLDDNPHMSTEELIVARCQQVVRNEEALEEVVKRVMDSRMTDKARWDQVENIRKEPLQVGEKVLVRNSALESTWSGQLERFKGPYKIAKRVGLNTFELEDLDGTRIKGPFPGQRLVRFLSTDPVEQWLQEAQDTETGELTTWKAGSWLRFYSASPPPCGSDHDCRGCSFCVSFPVEHRVTSWAGCE
ncbi:hypothetical protein CBR_g21886 [Chara braunii]|uniref:Integrase catalytic domain-containing protein n=1 Tax=Chara braunii TaxID=69332 RepID=A0A388L1L0_CHABU|nr:hypothetical protein CBR_g21886 [Chara braunii]|eukprot:GBG76138.1 hypothetical protein CBR_g21886 [Chara braunii]